MRELVRALGVLGEDRTPCGAPVSPREAHALLAVREREAQGAGLGQAELQRVVGVDKSNVARLVQRLRAQGRLRQVCDPQDGRRRVLELTARGRRLADALEQSGEALFSAVWRRLPPDERGEVTRALTRLSAALRAQARAREEAANAR